MNKSVWVAVNPEDPKDIVIKFEEPSEYNEWFYNDYGEQEVSAEYKPYALVELNG